MRMCVYGRTTPYDVTIEAQSPSAPRAVFACAAYPRCCCCWLSYCCRRRCRRAERLDKYHMTAVSISLHTHSNTLALSTRLAHKDSHYTNCMCAHTSCSRRRIARDCLSKLRQQLS